MKNKTFIMGALVASLCLSLLFSLGNLGLGKNALASGHGEISIDDLFHRSGCQWLQTDISSWAQCSAKDLGLGNLEDIAKGAKEFFELMDNPELTTDHQEENRRINLKGNDPKGLKYDIIIANSEETYIMVNVLVDGEFSNTQAIIEGIKDYYGSINVSPHIYATLTGGFSEELDTRGRKAIIKTLVKESGARSIQTMEDDKLISIAGYSPILNMPSMEGVNLQMASRYNSYKDTTYLWIGTPIITIQY